MLSLPSNNLSDFISPLLGSACDDLAQLDQGILSVSVAICNIADSLLPKRSHNRRPRRDFYNDGHLRHLCNLSKSSWRVWKNAGRPQSGDLLTNKNAAKKNVHARLNQLRARKDRLHSENIDDTFRARDNKRFRSPRDGTPSGSRLQVNNAAQKTSCLLGSLILRHLVAPECKNPPYYSNSNHQSPYFTHIP